MRRNLTRDLLVFLALIMLIVLGALYIINNNSHSNIRKVKEANTTILIDLKCISESEQPG